MYKNKLKELMLERDVSNHKLAKETLISRQAISKIKNNEFHDNKLQYQVHKNFRKSH